MRRGPSTIAGLLAGAVTAASMVAATAAEAPPDDEPSKSAVQRSVADRPQESARDTLPPREHGHGESEGHLPPTRENVEVVGKAPVSDRAPGRVADVSVFRDHAYLGAFADPSCDKGGVAVFDVAKPREPKEVGFIPTGPNSFVGEGVQTVHLETRHFNGDVLLFNNEICDELQPGTVGGATLVDVTDPRDSEFLAEGFGDHGLTGDAFAHEVHSAFLWQDGRKAYAVLVDDYEADDVDIFNVTDPRSPRKIAEHNLAELFPQIVQAGLDEVFLHDMVVKRIGDRPVMLLSYWDGGYVKLDVSDPRNPVYLGDSDFNSPDPELLARAGLREKPEGNGHYAEFTRDNEYVVGADEDFNPFGVNGETNDGSAFAAVGGSSTPPIMPDEPLTGTAVYVGRACNADPAVPAPPQTGGPWLAVAERGICTFDEKVANVEAVTANGGYAGTIIFNRTAVDGCGLFGGLIAGERPVVTISRRDGYGLFDIEEQYDEEECRAGTGEELAPIELGATGDVVTLTAFFNGWGYIHLFDNRLGKLVELDTFAVREAMDERYATRFGALSVHEVATSRQRDRLVYSSYYDAGFRVLKIKGDRLKPAGEFIDRRGNDFWGVDVFSHRGQELVAASDRDYGLYIFKYTGRPSTTRP
ncbi:MAG: hypothetical protein M3Q87_03470 [Actinomycetota bacterium]|nr:hypothetical protein [Actinomycetota bacterium]